MADVEFKGFADYRALHRENEKFRQDLLKIKRELAGVRDESRQGAQDSSRQNSLLREGAAAVGKYFSAWALGATAVRLVTDEIRNMMAVQERALRATQSVGDAQIAALRNVGAKTVGEREQFLQTVDDMSATTGVSTKDLYQRFGTGYSARGPLSTKAVEEAVRVSALVVPESAEEGTTFAGALLDLAKVTGSEDARANAGLLMSIGETSRVTDIGRLSKNLPPALTAIAAKGDTGQQAGAIFSAITTGMADPTGEQSKTAAISLAEQLAEALPEATQYAFKKQTKGGVTREVREVAAEGTGLKTTMERIRFLQENAEAREKFFGNATFEKASAESIRQLLRGEGTAAEALDVNLARMPSAQDAAAIFDERVGVIRGTEEQNTLRVAQVLESGLERLQTANQGGARIAAIRDKYGTLMQDSGLGALESKFRGLSFEASGPGEQRFIEELQSRAAELRKPKSLVGDVGGEGTEIVTERELRPLPPTQLEIRQAEILDQMAKTLTLLLEEQKQGNKDRANNSRDGKAGAAQAQRAVGVE